MGKIIVAYTLILKFLDSKVEDKRFCTELEQAFSDSNLLYHRIGVGEALVNVVMNIWVP